MKGVTCYKAYLGATTFLALLVILATSCSGGTTTTTGGEFSVTTIPSSELVTSSTTSAVTPYAGSALARFTTAHFVGSGNCAICHTGLTDADGNDVSIDTHWRSTMMANAAKDPFWQAMVASEVTRNPALKEAIEDTCATCHMPMARTQAATDGKPGLVLDNGFLSPDNKLHNAAMDGNSCALCHQIQDAALGEEESFAGGYQIDTTTPRPDKPIFGPYPDSERQIMRGTVGYTPQEGPQIGQSELCATCHTVLTPTVDEEGNIIGLFPEQTAYLEWSHSEYAGDNSQSCQSCHMPEASGGVEIANMPPNIPDRAPFLQHHFVGGNAFMLGILMDHAGELGLSTSSAQLSNTRERATFQLQSAALIELENVELQSGELSFEVYVENSSGHKFPTGFPSRRAWLHVTVTDGQGKVIFESGRPNEDGSIAGNNADETPGTYEPHRDIITSPDEVQIYESIMGDTSGDVTFTLLYGAGYLKDNRLLPQGFDKGTAEERVAVVGEALEDANFTGGSDRVSYQIDTTNHNGPFKVVVELLYQPLSYCFVNDMLGGEGSLIDRFDGYYQEADQTPERITIAGVRIIP
jgi:hypothetical protein